MSTPEQESTTGIAAIAAALAKAQAEMSGAVKDSTNPHFKSSYADLASVTKAIREPLTKNGISWTQSPSSSPDLNSVTVRTVLMHTSGQSLESTLTMPVAQRTPQAFGSALTYARRYSLSAMVGLEAEDDDGNEASKSEPRGSSKAQIWPNKKPEGQRVTQSAPVDGPPEPPPDNQPPPETEAEPVAGTWTDADTVIAAVAQCRTVPEINALAIKAAKVTGDGRAKVAAAFKARRQEVANG